MPTIVPIVEGPGDVNALPHLLVQILQQVHCRPDILVAQGKTRVVNAQNRANLEKKLEKFLAHAQNKPDCAAVLVLVDADNDCPVTEAKKLSKRCQEAVVSVPVQVVYAHREFESWLLASIESIRGNHGISENAFLQVDVEAVSNPKKWITDQMPHGMAYKETTHQAALAGQINLNLARMRSRSFQRLCHALEQLVAGISPS